MNHESKDITDPLKIHMHVQKLFNLTISTKAIRHAHLTFAEMIDCAQRLKDSSYLWKESSRQNMTL